MHWEGRHILLLADNFGAHYIDYEPSNITLEFFEPNLTSHVQPLDAGIIHCVKALYRKALCKRALDLEKAGNDDLFKIDILEVMRMLKRAWSEVKLSTIENCWKHTSIMAKDNNTSWEDLFMSDDAPSDSDDIHMSDNAGGDNPCSNPQVT